MKKILVAFIMLSVISQVFGQSTDDAQMFGAVQPASVYSKFDFDKISYKGAEHEFVISNDDAVDMEIISIMPPVGIPVFIDKKIIKVGEKGKVVVYIPKDFVTNNKGKGKFSEYFTITVQKKLVTGITITKTFNYYITGTL